MRPRTVRGLHRAGGRAAGQQLSGALDRGISRLAHRLRRRGTLLIAGIMGIFSLLGTVEGWAEET
ncbi:hypothetical protein, partial [Streptomyces albidoflavus]|uniref:hypothetical protein n=1 Tax=Streptomyces albidoflavus TaxID=1886 RepID=UPI001C3EB636